MKVLGDSLVTVIENAAARGNGLTILGKGGGRDTRSYSDLLGEAEIRAAGLDGAQIGRGDRVGILARPSFDFVVGCLALWRVGAVPAPLPPPSRAANIETWEQQANLLLDKARARALLVSPNHLHFEACVPVLKLHELKNGSAETDTAPRPDDAALVLFSSGTTSPPRGVVLRHRAVAAHLAIEERMGNVDPREDSFLSWGPLHLASGLYWSLLRPMAYGIPAILMSTRLFISNPAGWLAEISRNRTTHSRGPNFAYALATRQLERGLSDRLDLSCWKVASCGGEIVDPTTLERFAVSARPFGFDPRAFSCRYGLTEAGTVAVSPPRRGLRLDRVDTDALASGEAVPARTRDRSSTFASAGPPVPGASIRIVASDGEDVGERRVGEILVRTPWAMDGYLEDPEATEAAFVDGWLRTGDLGYVADGELFITGRAKDVIIVRGQNYYPEGIERIAERVPGVQQGSCVAVPISTGATEEIGLVAETKLESSEDQESCRKELVRLIWAETGIAPKRILLVPPGTLPKTTSGKVQRSRARRLLEET